MMDIVSLLTGLAAGATAGGLVVYLLPYQILRRDRGVGSRSLRAQASGEA